MKEEFEKNGYYVLRGVLTEAEVDQLATPIRAAFARGDYDTFHKGPAYPAPGIHSMGPRVLEDHPEIADVSLAHPAIMEAIEEVKQVLKVVGLPEGQVRREQWRSTTQ